MKNFLTLTAYLEGLTALALIAFPNRIVKFLLDQPIIGTAGTITTMLAGAAILSLAVICWLLRETANPQKLVKGLLFYNCLIIAIVMFGLISYGLTGTGLWLIVISHAGLSVWGAVTLRVK